MHGNRIMIAAAVILAAVFLYVSAFAKVVLVKETDHDGISVVSGGIGVYERDYMESKFGGYSFKAVFALSSGNYVSEVEVTVRDESGNPVVETVTAGPWLMAQLPPGHYSIEAVFQNEAKTKNFRVGEMGTTSVYIHWKQ